MPGVVSTRRGTRAWLAQCCFATGTALAISPEYTTSAVVISPLCRNGRWDRQPESPASAAQTQSNTGSWLITVRGPRRHALGNQRPLVCVGGTGKLDRVTL